MYRDGYKSKFKVFAVTLITVLSLMAYANAGQVKSKKPYRFPDAFLIICIPATEDTLTMEGVKVQKWGDRYKVCWMDYAANKRKYTHSKEGKKILNPLTREQSKQLTKEI